MRRTIIILALAFAVWASAQPARADLISSLDVVSKSNIGSGTLGTVDVSQNGADEVDLTVKLSDNTAFVDTGGPHTAFAFNLDLSSGYVVTITSPTGGIFSLAGLGQSDTPYGSFSYGIDCPGCGPGASHANPGPLELKITDASGISLNDFVANADGYFFAADVIGPSGGTGAIAADKITATVPEPPSLALFAGLLFGAWFSISFATGRLRRLSGAFRQAQS